MSSVTTLKSYLVSLGFDSNMGQFNTNFEKPIQAASALVKKETFGIAGDVLKWQGSIVGMFAAISAGVLHAMDKVAMADQEYRLFGERMFMDTNHARAFKTALDALGQPLEAIAFDPELHDRFLQLIADQKQMSAGLGTDYEANMRRIRDIHFEVTRFKVELQYVAMGATNSIFKALGFESDDFLKNLQHLNDWIRNNIPAISEEFARYLVPVLKDTKDIMLQTWDVAKEGSVIFQNLIGILSNDSSIEGTTASFDKFAKSIEHVIGWLKSFLDAVFNAEEMLAHMLNAGELGASGHYVDAAKELAAAYKNLTPGAGTIVGGVAGVGIGGVVGGAIGAQAGPVGAVLGAGAGSVVGGIVGAGGGYGVGKLNQYLQHPHSMGMSFTFGNNQPAALSNPVANAKQIATQIGVDLHLPANIQKYIFEQMAFETGGFTNRGVGFNNFAGIKDKTGEYQHFATVQDFIKRYEGVLSAHRYAGLFQSQSELDFASILKAGGYYADDKTGKAATPMQYAGGMVKYGDTYNIDVHVTQPNASADQIANAVHRKLESAQGRDIATMFPQIQGSY